MLEGVILKEDCRGRWITEAQLSKKDVKITRYIAISLLLYRTLIINYILIGKDYVLAK